MNFCAALVDDNSNATIPSHQLFEFYTGISSNSVKSHLSVFLGVGPEQFDDEDD